MSRDTIIDDQNRLTRALLDSLLSPTVADQTTQEAANAEFATYLSKTTNSVIALSELDASTGTLPTFPAGARLLIGAGAEASRGRADVAAAEGAVLRAYREL